MTHPAATRGVPRHSGDWTVRRDPAGGQPSREGGTVAEGGQETRRASVCRRNWAGPQRTWRRAPETGSPSTAEDEGSRRLPGTGQGRAAGPRAETEGSRRYRSEMAPAGWTAQTNDPATPRRDGAAATPPQEPRRPRPQPVCPVPRLRLHRRQVSRSPRVARGGGRYLSTTRPHAGPPSRSPAPSAANARHARTHVTSGASALAGFRPGWRWRGFLQPQSLKARERRRLRP